ncbi:MAG: HRDC domain-containing protein, partial [Nitrospirota bacterium]
ARPLSHDQLAYALEDVTFLLAIHDHLHGRLSKLGRLQWVDEEFSRLEGAVGETRREPQERYQRIRGWDQLKPKSAVVLRELATWREGEAKRRNVPRSRVVRDEVLLQLARQPPRHQDELRNVRGLHASEIDRNGESMLAAIHALFRELLGLPAPMVAAVRGQCLGGAFELVLCCPIVFATPDARF